jgi:CheY-like chemotaxis protein
MEASAATNPAQVLVADDEPGHVELLAEILSGEGYRRAPSRDRALAILREEAALERSDLRGIDLFASLLDREA